MKTLILKPSEWPCKLSECPPGFFVYEGSPCFKTEYGFDEVFNEAGEVFWGGLEDKNERSDLVVTPCTHEWIDL